MYANFCVYDLDAQAHTSTWHVWAIGNSGNRNLKWKVEMEMVKAS